MTRTGGAVRQRAEVSVFHFQRFPEQAFRFQASRVPAELGFPAVDRHFLSRRRHVAEVLESKWDRIRWT